jgi:hypothetical protein
MPISTVNQKGLDAPLTLTSPTLSGTTTATTVTSPAATALTLQSAGTTAVTIDTSQNFYVNKTAYSDTSGNGFGVFPNSGIPQVSCVGAGNSSQKSFTVYSSTDSSYKFYADYSGNGYFANKLYVGTTSGTNAATALRNVGSASGKFWQSGPDTNNNYIVYNQAGTGAYLLDGATSWAGNSDERLKTDLKPIENAAEKVDTLRAVTGRFKTDEESISRSFLIAQDVQKVLPEAVVNSPEGMLGITYTDVIPLLVAAIKELKAEIDVLKASK